MDVQLSIFLYTYMHTHKYPYIYKSKRNIDNYMRKLLVEAFNLNKNNIKAGKCSGFYIWF